MKNILLIGVGGTGSAAVDIFFQKKKELGSQSGNNITALVFDTDAGDLQKISAAKTIDMTDTASVGTICDRFDQSYLREWFPCDDKAVRAQEMLRGASQWRKKSYLAFVNLMNKPLKRQTFISALEDMTVDPGAGCEIYIIASVAGGTGSGSFIPIALYAKRYLRKTLGKDPIVNAMIALPDIYAESQTAENRVKIYSNAYAILRELNAINLVSRNYNAGVAQTKKAPIRFKIGDERDPNVGLLFDASDKRFWTPEAAPFSQVFLLDKVPGLNSIAAHNIVLANSLYTILCTNIGSEFDSEFSNHELLRSQNNGSNAIYAGISTSQIRFPKDSVLDYLAHKKTLESCDNEWMILHKAVENHIREKEQEEKASRRRYIMKDGEYADIVVQETENLENGDNDEFLAMLERCVYTYDESNKKQEGEDSFIAQYVQKLNTFIGKKISPIDTIVVEIGNEAYRFIDKDTGKAKKGSLNKCYNTIHPKLMGYYRDCIDNIKRLSGGAADAIICLDKKKAAFTSDKLSVENILLKKNDQYIHPVAAMIRLCYLRKAISYELAKAPKNVWGDITKRTIEGLPKELTKLESTDNWTENAHIKMLIASGNSAYHTSGDERYSKMSPDPSAKKVQTSKSKKTNANADLGFLWMDALCILKEISDQSKAQMRKKVYSEVAAELDLLIAKYRSFFNRFEKEKEDLVELTKTAYLRDSTNIDSVVNVFSSKNDKDVIYNKLVEEAGPATDKDLIETDDIVGGGVYASVYNSASCERARDGSYNENDSGAYRSLFGSMIKAYRSHIESSEGYAEIASYNVVEAIVEQSGGITNDNNKFFDAFGKAFSVAQELAKPSLRLDAADSKNDLVTPSDIMVFMMSENTGRYLKRHAEDFRLSLPADQTNEKEVIKSCAEQFIRRYSGNNQARVSIVSSMSDQVLYCTGEIMDITPLRISKFNELGDDNIYFKNYTIAIINYAKYGTDMWNPHLGNNLHKRGYLPYMNMEMERECDIKVVKALLYAFQKKIVEYKDGISATKGKFFFCCNGAKIKDATGKWINNKNIAQLVSWMRNEDAKVEEWSSRFDEELQIQLCNLPSIVTSNSTETRNLETRITLTPFMTLLTDKLYDDPTRNASNRTKIVGGNSSVVDEYDGPSALEFAYLVKTSEESGRDCDDAERILKVLYSTFVKMCDYRVPRQTAPDLFITVYNQQIGNVYTDLAHSAPVVNAGASCESLFIQIKDWMSQTNVFKAISLETPMNDKGEIIIDTVFDHTKDPTLKNHFEQIKRKK